MTTTEKHDFRLPNRSKWRAPRAVADGGGGTIIATVEVDATPERVFELFTTNEVERWWGHPQFYRWTDWAADLRVCGQWSVAVRFTDGNTNHGYGEFVEIDAPHKLVMTREFETHPLLGKRETTITYYFEPIATGTRVTVRDEGFIGRAEAAYGNAEHWERVLGWLQAYVTDETAEVHPGDDVASIIGSFAAQLTEPEQPFVLLARFRTSPGQEAAVRSSFADARPLALRDRGCLSFDLCWSAQNPHEFVVVERWQSLSDLEDHLRMPHTTGHREIVNDLIDGLPQFELFAAPAG